MRIRVWLSRVTRVYTFPRFFFLGVEGRSAPLYASESCKILRVCFDLGMGVEKLKTIREKCIAANPAGDIRTECMNDGYDYREVWLVDILLATDLDKIKILAERVKPLAGEVLLIIGKWNLRTDDLEKQSKETIDFIYQLLA